jgi:hypothetical protein
MFVICAHVVDRSDSFAFLIRDRCIWNPKHAVGGSSKAPTEFPVGTGAGVLHDNGP